MQPLIFREVPSGTRSVCLRCSEARPVLRDEECYQFHRKVHVFDLPNVAGESCSVHLAPLADARCTLHDSKVESKIILSDDVPEGTAWVQCTQAGFAFVKLTQGREFLVWHMTNKYLTSTLQVKNFRRLYRASMKKSNLRQLFCPNSATTGH